MTVPTDLSRAETLRTLREQVNTHVALPGEPGYERCMPWNVAAAITPAAVVLATIICSAPPLRTLHKKQICIVLGGISE